MPWSSAKNLKSRKAARETCSLKANENLMKVFRVLFVSHFSLCLESLRRSESRISDSNSFTGILFRLLSQVLNQTCFQPLYV